MHSGKRCRRTKQPGSERAGGFYRKLSPRFAYYTTENNPTLYGEAEMWLELVISERDESR